MFFFARLNGQLDEVRIGQTPLPSTGLIFRIGIVVAAAGVVWFLMTLSARESVADGREPSRRPKRRQRLQALITIPAAMYALSSHRRRKVPRKRILAPHQNPEVFNEKNSGVVHGE